MSLWTPGGEHQVPRTPPTPTPAAEVEPDDDFGSFDDIPGFDELSPEEQAQAIAMAQQLAETRERLAETPASEVVANHVMGLYELAAIHLSVDPPSFDDARLAIDAMAALTTSLEGRLGQHESTLREALAQLQVAFVEVKRHIEQG